jgi:hypothetical protein
MIRAFCGNGRSRPMSGVVLMTGSWLNETYS